MQKQSMVLALGAAFAAFGAHAQQSGDSSNVTIYGIVDSYLQTAKGDSTLTRVESGGLSGSRLGFRGTEDLGAGLRATFTLEAGINLDNGTSGQGGVLFGRQAFVGLTDEDYGQITLGRQYSSLYYASTEFSAFSNVPAGPTTAVIGGFAGGYEPVRGASGTAVPPQAGATGNGSPARVNNSIRYQSPSLAGFQLGAMYGAGEQSGATSNQRLIDLFARYSTGPVNVILSHISDRTVNDGTDVNTTTLAASYAIGPAHVLAGFMNVDDGRSADLSGRGYWLGGDYRIKNHLIRAQYVRNDPRYGSDNLTQAFGVGYQYDISRRTALYSSITRFANQKNAGDNGLGRWNAAVPAGLTSAGNNDITELVAGLRHLF